MRKTQIVVNKSVYLSISISDMRKTVMYKFWCDYVKPKYCENVKFCYLDKHSFIVHIYNDIAEFFKTRFDT